MRTAALVSLVFLVACTVSYDTDRGPGGSAAAGFGGESDSREDIDVGIDLKERPQVVPGMTRAGATFVVEVANRSPETVRLTRVQLQSVAEEAEMMPLTGAKFNKEIAPGQKTKVELSAFFDVGGNTLMALEGPMLVRATLYLRDAAGTESQEYFTRRLGSLAAGGTANP
jgi:hypothetical protein